MGFVNEMKLPVVEEGPQQKPIAQEVPQAPDWWGFSSCEVLSHGSLSLAFSFWDQNEISAMVRHLLHPSYEHFHIHIKTGS